MSDKEKTFSENAKGFLGMWKDDYAEKNKEILDRKKKRDAETEQMNKEMEALWSEVKVDMQGKAAEIYEVLSVQFQGFTQAVKEGSATIAEKIELEKRLEQLGQFLKATGNKGAEKFNKFAVSMQKKLSDFDNELVSEKETSIDDVQNEADNLFLLSDNNKSTK